MSKKALSTEKAPGAIGPYSQGIEVIPSNGLIFTSGQLPIDSSTGELKEDIKEATKQSMENCKAIIESAGSSMDKVIKTLVFLRDIDDFAAMNEVYSTFFSENPPARSAVQVAKIPKGAILEIEMIAEK